MHWDMCRGITSLHHRLWLWYSLYKWLHANRSELWRRWEVNLSFFHHSRTLSMSMSIELSPWMLRLLESNLPGPWKQRNSACALSKSRIVWKTTFTYWFRRYVLNILSVIEIFGLGSVESNLDFEFETENQVYYSCIATLFGNFYVLGGSSQNGRQVTAKNLYEK